MSDEAKFSSVDDVDQFVRTTIKSAVETHLDKFGAVRAMAVVLATFDPAARAPMEAVTGVAVGGDGRTHKELRPIIQGAVRKFHAPGVIQLTAEGRVVKVNLEHANLGDLEWTAEIRRKRIGEFGPAKPPEKVTRLLPRRYMS